jgi:hypothetical protein
VKKTKLYLGGQLVLEKQQRPQSEWVIDPVFLEGVGDDSKLVGLIEDYFNWEEADWSENKLLYENDLEHLEELPTKEKM